MAIKYVYRETIDAYVTGAFVVDNSFNGSAASSI
jgi:hypothetical protein